MTKYFDEFKQLKQKEMAKTLEDITYKYINPTTQMPTKVPSSHYEKEFNREIERQISAGVSRQMLSIMFTTISDLKKESPELFAKALICLDNNINPKDMRLDEQIALEETYKEFESLINPPKKQKEPFHLLNEEISSAYNNLKNSDTVQGEVMRMLKAYEDMEDQTLNIIRKQVDRLHESNEDDNEDLSDDVIN